MDFWKIFYEKKTQVSFGSKYVLGLRCNIISNTKCANMKIESNNKWTKTILNYNVQTHFRFTTFGGPLICLTLQLWQRIVKGSQRLANGLSVLCVFQEATLLPRSCMGRVSTSSGWCLSLRWWTSFTIQDSSGEKSFSFAE